MVLSQEVYDKFGDQIYITVYGQMRSAYELIVEANYYPQYE